MKGWTFRESDSPFPRRDRPPVEFHAEDVPPDPASPAFGDEDFFDPEEKHSHLPLGTRYWQGHDPAPATPAPANFRRDPERAMSPEWVARVTRPGAVADEEETDPQWPRVVRDKERDSFNRRFDRTWPG